MHATEYIDIKHIVIFWILFLMLLFHEDWNA